MEVYAIYGKTSASAVPVLLSRYEQHEAARLRLRKFQQEYSDIGWNIRSVPEENITDSFAAQKDGETDHFYFIVAEKRGE